MKRSANIFLGIVALGVLLTGWTVGFISPHDQVETVRNYSEVARISQNKLSAPSVSQATSVNDKSFQLHFGLKADFDLFIFKHQSKPPAALTEAFYSASFSKGYDTESLEYLVELFSRYIDYKVQLHQLDAPLPQHDITAISRQLQSRDDLRYHYFSQDEYHFIFSQDTAYDKAALARLKIASDPDYSREQKLRLIETQLQTLPLSQQASFEPSLQVNRIAALQKEYDNDEVRFHAVAAEFDHEIALRLEMATLSQSRWDQKVNKFREWRAQLLASDDLSKEQAGKKIAYRRDADFTLSEQRRLRVYLENPDLLKRN